jgi:hypothetical protein
MTTEENYVNRYVIKRGGGHRWTQYHIVSTLSGYKEMLRSLEATVSGLDDRSSSDPQFKIPTRQIWGSTATLSPGMTSFIYLSFDIEPNLDAYHKKRFWRRSLFEYLFLLLFLAILILAGIGAIALIRLL